MSGVPSSTNYLVGKDTNNTKDLTEIFESYTELISPTFYTNYLLPYNSSLIDISEMFVPLSTPLTSTDTPVNYIADISGTNYDLSQVFVPKTFVASNQVNINIINHSVDNYVIYSFSTQKQVGSSNEWVNTSCILTFPSAKTLNLIAVGGGGGGGYAQDNSSGGGGAGGSYISASGFEISKGESVNVQVGSGGSLYINGYQNGEESFFGTYVTASGGAQGQNATTSSNGNGGLAGNNGAGGDSGDNGTNGNVVNIDNVLSFYTGGGGGGGVESNSSSAFYGGGNGAVSITGGSAGVTNEYPINATGTGYGAGGGGGGGIPGEGVAGGGAGSAGLVVLWYNV